MQSLRLAFCLFAYRPYGGLQRDFYRIAQVCAGRGHRVDVFTKEWQGDAPDNFKVHVLSLFYISGARDACVCAPPNEHNESMNYCIYLHFLSVIQYVLTNCNYNYTTYLDKRVILFCQR